MSGFCMLIEQNSRLAMYLQLEQINETTSSNSGNTHKKYIQTYHVDKNIL